MSKRLVLGVLAMAALPLLMGVSGGMPNSLPFRFYLKSSPHVQTVVGWMVGGTISKASGAFSDPRVSREDVLTYVSLLRRSGHSRTAISEPNSEGGLKATGYGPEDSSVLAQLETLRPRVESLLETQVAEALRAAGLDESVGGIDLLLPPPLFHFGPPPKLLIVSPRTRIQQLGTVLLQPRLAPEEAERLEDSVADGDLSALVTGIGGLGVYPSMVPESPDLQGTLRTVSHEWAHQYLALRPLGWRYALGAEKDGRMVTINETTAEILGREIGDVVYRQWYSDAPGERGRPTLDDGPFRRAIGEVRVRVDELLAEGRVEEAESYMESSRQELARKGYQIRKLNQAYLAFNGSYAEEPSLAGRDGAGIAGRILALRRHSASVGDFLRRISESGSYEEFLRLAPPP